MTDYFALLDEPRRPWLDPDSLKQKFFALASGVHPDRVHNAGEADRHAAQQRYTDLNAAYHCLREPKTRLRHLLELERGGKPGDLERVASDLMELFEEVSRSCREADAFLSEKARTTSPLLKVQLFARGRPLADNLNALAGKIKAQRDALLVELQAMNLAWESAPVHSSERQPALPLERLEKLYRLLGFFDRWTAQLQERGVQLLF